MHVKTRKLGTTGLQIGPLAFGGNMFGWTTHQTAPRADAAAACAALTEQGEVRPVGASTLPAARLARALEVSRSTGLPSYQCLQPNYSLCERAGFEEGLEPLCLQAGLGVIPYF